ncbi:hypothetical protein K9M48_00280 [Candidatus Gracilibacteria bacterium]|nr:hypothetical protein [Candidatus Gracilibacteria bacterium]
MQIKEKKINYFENENLLSFKESLSNGIQIRSNILFEETKFLDFQKDLVQDFFAELIELCNQDIYDINDIKSSLETGLEALNTKLRLFADKVRDVERFFIKGYIQIIVDNIFMASMIGDLTIMIFRDNKVYYSLHNGIDNRAKSDLFSDFVEGDIEKNDEIIYVGTKISDVLDDQDLKEVEDILDNEQSDLLDFIEQLLLTRIQKENIGFMAYYRIHGAMPKKSAIGENFKNSLKNSKLMKIKDVFFSNKYHITVLILALIVLFLLYSVLSQLLEQKGSTFTTQSGTVIDVTIDDIKKDIYLFKSMDPTSDQKGIKYNEILQKLSHLETKGRRVEDIIQLRKILQADYYAGFNIIYLTDLAKLDDPAMNKKTKIFNFSPIENSKFGLPQFISVEKDMMIAGSKSAIMGAVNDSIRGTLVEYMKDENMKGCSSSLLRNGLYCFTDKGNIYLITKTGLEPLSSTDGFPARIGGVAVYGKANLYVFPQNLGIGGLFVTRYRNTLGSQSIFQDGQNYSLALASGSTVNSGYGNFSSFAIDSTFLARSNGKLNQLWRDPASTWLSIREVPLMGGDKATSSYSNDVKVIAKVGSKYVYLFDRTNQTFTIYESRPLKTNDAYSSQYSLYYMFRITFDLNGNKIIDIDIPERTGDRPELYMLSNDGVNKVNLYEFIDNIKNNNTLPKME